ncbi:PAS-domain containing protein [Aestuariibacter halophilus]|uniref:histidine kinase n=1 Tax=Fluctibacter halophilus TaxID=226011 RepID=A0ABS8G773_9ALTE|nr:PAS-domain containing protein [Aestuariibacter halophilus]MCC2616373.1 PAS-domain containing protein [Aestuariibacter halophilus]
MALSWMVLAFAYLAGLFWLARWGDSSSPLARKLTSHPLVYSLALAIYCTAWTFFGAVGEASRNAWQYLPIMLGPILLYTLGYRFIHKLTLVSKKQHITTIADFISSRYGKRQTVALLVTLIALLATIPYVALQLKAIGAAFQVVSTQSEGQVVVMLATLFMAAFSIYFGTQRTDVTEYRRGLMLAIAFESSIKLLALIAIAAVAYVMWKQQGNTNLMAAYTTPQAFGIFTSFPFVAQTIMAAAAVICLPRQFHVAVIDNLSLHHLKTARWVFPGYLLIISLVIPILASVGTTLLGQTSLEPDTYVLGLANLADSILLQMLVFVGGLSAATAMIIVATLTLSTMLTNDVILPRLLAFNNDDKNKVSMGKHILAIRRVVIGVLLLLAYLYYQQMTNSRSLASIGLIAFSLVIQLLPAIVGGLYWKRGHAHGVYAGLITGVCTWLLWLFLPLMDGQPSVQWHNETLSQGAIISLVTNAFAYGLFSYFAPSRLIDRIQAQAFVSPREHQVASTKKSLTSATVADLLTLLTTFLGESRCQLLVEDYQRRADITQWQDDAPPEPSFIAFCERALGGVLGGSSAKALIDSVLSGKKLGFEEVVNFFDDTTQALQFNTSALFTSIESLDQGISVVDKDLNLVAWNKRYLELFDYPDDMISVGTPIERLVRYNAIRGECGVGDIDELVSRRLEHMREGHPHRFLRQRSDGKVIEMVGNPLPGGGFVTSFSDVTEHIELQEALKESNIDLENRIRQRGEEVQAINAELRTEIERRAELEKALVSARKVAEQANASKTRFLALASHDILQPLNAAKLYLSALDEMPMNKEATETLAKLSSSVNASETLIATLLDIARLDQGELPLHIKPLSLKQLLTPLASEFAMQAQRKGLHFRARIPDIWVNADKTYVYRIVQNLLSNAIKYTVSGRVLLQVSRHDQQVTIRVWDSGVGISNHEQSQVFNDFYRVGDSQEHGVGLGLGVVSRLAEKLGAPLHLQSTLGRGSCFSVTLEQAPAEVKTATVASAPASMLQGLQVLVVDDKRENLDAMQTLLNKWGVSAHLAATQDLAKEIVARSPVEVALVDFHLGSDIDGLQLVAQLRKQQDSHLPAVLITANQDGELSRQCHEQDVHFLAKPVKPAKLRALLQSLRQAANQQAQASAPAPLK